MGNSSYRFLFIQYAEYTCSDTIENHTATNIAFNVGQSFEWHFADDDPILVVSSFSPPPPPPQLKKFVRVGTPLTRLSWSAHGPICSDLYDFNIETVCNQKM